MFLVTVIVTSCMLVTSTTEAADAQLKDYMFKNNLTVSFKVVGKAVIVDDGVNHDHDNTGDLVWGEKWDNDTLLFREIFVNDINTTAPFKYLMNVKNTSYVITGIRFLNLGRQRSVKPDVKVVRLDKVSTAELQFSVRQSEQVRIWIEIFGRNGSSLLTSSWMLISISSLFYYILNKY